MGEECVMKSQDWLRVKVEKFSKKLQRHGFTSVVGAALSDDNANYHSTPAIVHHSGKDVLKSWLLEHLRYEVMDAQMRRKP